MDRESLLSGLEHFDPEIFGRFQEELQRQRYMLSFVPTINAESPYAAYLEGSVLASCYLDYHTKEQPYRGFEKIAAERAKSLFHSDHAIVRLDGIAAASRTVLRALLPDGGQVLSFRNRKKEHVRGDAYTFASFGVDLVSREVNWAELQEKADSLKPALVIFSPVNYAKQTDYGRMADIAHAAGARFWVDLGQNVGLTAAGLLASPVSFADVVTFPTNDSLRGPEGAVILCRENLADILDQTVLESGFASIHKNKLAALALALHEAASPEYRAYGRQVLQNAKALAKSLQANGIEVLSGGTENHLVIAKLPADIDAAHIDENMAKAGFYTKKDETLLDEKGEPLCILRLSCLSPTTRSLKESDMEKVGELLAKGIRAASDAERETIRETVGMSVMDKPIFSEEWLPKARVHDRFFDGSDRVTAREVAASERRDFVKKLFLHKDGQH